LISSTFNRLVTGNGFSSFQGFGRSPESWLAMQDNYNLWQARNRVDLDNIQRMAFA